MSNKIVDSIADELVARIQRDPVLSSYRRSISNRKTHSYRGNAESLKQSVLAGIARSRVGKWKPTDNQSRELDSACKEYTGSLYSQFVSGSTTQFKVTVLAVSNTNFTATITGDGVVENFIQRLRDKAGLTKFSNTVKKIFSVDRKQTTIDLGHLSGTTVAEQYATEVLVRLESVGIRPADSKAYELLKLKINYNPLSTKAASIGVEDQFFGVNQSTTEEAEITKLLNKAVGPIVKNIASDIIGEAALRRAEKKLLDAAKKAGAKVKSTKQEEESSGSKTVEVKTPLKSKSGKIFSETSSATSEQTSQNWSSVISLINSRLAAQVISNMHTPALVNRTGTFANSVEVTRVTQTPQGYPSIEYTYDTSPYGVFDMTLGADPWRTPERHPPKIIEKSIRQIMADLAIGRFYLRRAPQ